MSFTHKITRGFDRAQSPADAVTHTEEVSADAEDNRDIAVPDSSTDLEVAITIDADQIKSLYIVSDQAVTLETNSGSAPDDTFSLVANKPLQWTTGDYHSNPITADVTSIFLTNSSGEAATVKVRLLQDSTP